MFNSLLKTNLAERIWINTSPIQINTDFGERKLSMPFLADVAFHALVNIRPAKVGYSKFILVLFYVNTFFEKYLDLNLNNSTMPRKGWNGFCSLAFQISVALQPMSKIRVAVNHFQFIQIMNLISRISDFVDQLISDYKFFSANRSNGNDTAIEMVCFFDEVHSFLLTTES